MKYTLKALVLILSAMFIKSIGFSQYTEQDKIVASDRDVQDVFGPVAIFNDYAVVGAPREDDNGFDAGAAYLYQWDPTGCQWVQIDKFVAESAIGVPDGTPSAQFGNVVSISGNLIAVGAYKHNHSGYIHSGAVYIYEIVAGTAVFRQKIMGQNNTLVFEGGNSDYFGHSVKLHRNRLIIGSYNDYDENGTPGSFVGGAGAAYIYTIGTYPIFDFETKLVAPVRALSDLFGFDVSIYGRYAIVGAPWEDEDEFDNATSTVNNSGSAYIYVNSGGWTLLKKIVATDSRDPDDYFGYSVDIDNNNIAIGAPYDDNNDSTLTPLVTNAGSAFFWRRIVLNWNFDQKVVASDRAADDIFGWEVATVNDKAVVGAPFEDHDISGANYMFASGSAYIFERFAPWSQTQKIVSSDRSGNDLFGQRVGISSTNVIVGAVAEDHDDIFPYTGGYNFNAGSAYIFNETILPTIPLLSSSSSTNCAPGSPVTLTITSGTLNDATHWQWYEGSCGGTPVGVGTSIVVNPTVTTTYYVHGEGCFTPGACASITVDVSNGYWHQTTQTGPRDLGKDVITDANGNVYVAGFYALETTFQGGGNPSVTVIAGSPLPYSHSYVSKYDNCGNLMWVAYAIQNNNSKSNLANSIVLDENSQHVYICGNLSEEIHFVEGTGVAGVVSPLTVSASPGANTAYVARLDMLDGHIDFVEAVAVLGSNITKLNAITINENNGRIYVGGEHSILTGSGTYKLFVQKYSPPGSGLGAINWQIDGYAHYREALHDMDFDENSGPNGSLWFVGEFGIALKLTPGVTLVSGPGLDAFVAKYDDNGGSTSEVFLRKGNIQSGEMIGEGVSVNSANGYGYITGYYRGKNTDAFEMTSHILPYTNFHSAYFVAMDGAANPVWTSAMYAGVNGAFVKGSGVSFKGNAAYFTGTYTQSNVFFDGAGGTAQNAPYIVSGASTSQIHTYVTSYNDLTGELNWLNVTTDPVSNTSMHTSSSITTDNFGNGFVVGGYMGTMGYLNGIPNSGDLVSSGGQNAFTMRVVDFDKWRL